MPNVKRQSAFETNSSSSHSLTTISECIEKSRSFDVEFKTPLEKILYLYDLSGSYHYELDDYRNALSYACLNLWSTAFSEQYGVDIRAYLDKNPLPKRQEVDSADFDFSFILSNFDQIIFDPQYTLGYCHG